MTTSFDELPTTTGTYLRCKCAAFTFVPEVGSATCSGCGKYTFTSDGKYIAITDSADKKAKAEPEGTVNREYLVQVCGELTATKLLLHDTQRALQKEIDRLKAKPSPEIAVATAYMGAEDAVQKEIDTLRERAEKAEAALATVQDLSHPNCKMLIKERDSMRGMWDNASLDAFQRLKGELQESGGLAYILNLTINLLKDRKAVYNKLSTVAEERDALKAKCDKTPFLTTALIAERDNLKARLAALTSDAAVDAGLRAFLTSTHNRDGILNALAAARDAAEGAV